MEHVDVKDIYIDIYIYIDHSVASNVKDLKFEKVIIKEFKKGMVFAICYKLTWSEEVYVI